MQHDSQPIRLNTAIDRPAAVMKKIADARRHSWLLFILLIDLSMFFPKLEGIEKNHQHQHPRFQFRARRNVSQHLLKKTIARICWKTKRLKQSYPSLG
jgi:hypothetical protein